MSLNRALGAYLRNPQVLPPNPQDTFSTGRSENIHHSSQRGPALSWLQWDGSFFFNFRIIGRDQSCFAHSVT